MPIHKVYLELTNRCNLNCTMCYRNAWNYETQDMEEQLLEKCLKDIKAIDTLKKVILGGIGEPTFSPKVEEVMYKLKDKHLTLTTNGTIMHPSMLEAIVECVDHIIVSIDGTNEVFFSIRNFSLDQIKDNINAINKRKNQRGSKTPLISLQMVISRTNQDQMTQIIDIGQELQASQIIFSNILPNDLIDQDLILYKLYKNSEMQKHFQNVRNYALRRGMEIMLPAFQLKTERRCRFIDEDAVVITASGDISPCYRFSHSGSEVVFDRQKEVISHRFGNIRKDSLLNIWNRPEYVAFRSTVYNNHYPSCIDCDLVDGCDMVRSTTTDCHGNSPSCADCLWSRKLIHCV